MSWHGGIGDAQAFVLPSHGVPGSNIVGPAPAPVSLPYDDDLGALGLDIVTPMGPISMPVDAMANAAFDAVWPRMQEKLREETARERWRTFAMVGGAVAIVLGANALLAKWSK
jgi:hypothetical protein